MRAQILTFHLRDIGEQIWRAAAEEHAPALAAVPGLLGVVWLADPRTNTYGGVYLWRDEMAMAAHLASSLYTALAANPHLTDVASRTFAVVAGPAGPPCDGTTGDGASEFA